MSTWPFEGYEKMPERPERWELDESGYRTLTRATWVVTEKIHGANFCVATDGRDLRCAKRKQLLADDEDFFGHQRVLPRVADAVRALHAALVELAGNARTYVYGELCGGAYPHPDVAPEPDVQAVQTGIYYSPRIEFCAFDVAITTGDDTAYLPYDQAVAQLAQVGLLYARPLLVGSYEDALGFPLGFDSTVPAQLGLPPLPGPNPAEGVVIKPHGALTFADRPPRFRPVLKRKHPAFAEDRRFHQASKWAPTRAPGWTPSRAQLCAFAGDLLTDARLHAAASKLGRGRADDPGQRAALIALVIADVHDQLAEDLGAALPRAAPADRAAMAELVDAQVRALVDLYLAIG